MDIATFKVPALQSRVAMIARTGGHIPLFHALSGSAQPHVLRNMDGPQVLGPYSVVN
jgi:hypothetical protein